MENKWHKRFLEVALLVSSWSKDPSTQVGAVIVDSDKRIVSTGYNGFPRGVHDCPELLKNREEKYKRIVHAELNAILNSPRSVKGCTLYITKLSPCSECTKAIIQSGIKEVYLGYLKEPNEKWSGDKVYAYDMLERAGVVVKEVDCG